ncbi:hypothetical protein KFK09_002166 [Dendrobium nobile]|uniref:Ubiquitin-like protease family profile domain-containing protein n=1 Tax=Dendrobium nobile TaxID=94219 RepID=A0A8T3CD12_DENNO|nr:hypothetical protein KFK09_002162 [Dendrobium nobile]KAI0529612.1 hypothetical protein KFK09_002166 [Dendrobium nobile]
MGALTDQRKRSSADLRLPISSASPKKPRLIPPSSSPISSNIPQPTPFRRLVHAPQRIIRAFGLGSSSTRKWKPSSIAEMGNFFSQLSGKKQDEMFALEEYKKLVEEQSGFPGDEVGKVSSVQPTSPELSTRNETEILDGSDALSQKVEDGGMLTINEADILDGSDVVSEKVEDGRNMALELVHKREERILVKKEPLYKELYEKAKKHDTRLNSLNFEVEVLYKKVIGFRIEAELLWKREEKPKEKIEELFYPLTAEEEEEISIALFSGNSHKVLVAHESSNIQITREVLQCLRPGAWLNDEVINLYFELLKEREKREPKKFLKCHFFNTFFYKKLTSEKHGYDFKAVKRWTTQRKLGYALIECDKIFVPIHKEIHWCLAVINVKDGSFQYLDSLGGLDNHVLKMLARYLKDEVRDKSGKEIDTLSWKKEFVDELPLQKNGWDCGMFMLKYADFYSRGLKLRFSQEHMAYFRKRTALDILRLKAG